MLVSIPGRINRRQAATEATAASACSSPSPTAVTTHVRQGTVVASATTTTTSLVGAVRVDYDEGHAVVSHVEPLSDEPPSFTTTPPSSTTTPINTLPPPFFYTETLTTK